MGTRICFIRHGETDWNVKKRIQGQLDIPLSAAGRAQARAVAHNVAHHRFAAIYSSHLSRALETARAIAERKGLEVRILPQICERNYGIFEGLTAAEAAVKYPKAYAFYAARDPHYDFETGERMLDFAARVTEGVDWMVRHHQGQTVCAVCHGGVLDFLYRKATGRPLSAPRDFVIPNCALNWFYFDEHGWHLEKWADRHHLDVLVKTPE